MTMKYSAKLARERKSLEAKLVNKINNLLEKYSSAPCENLLNTIDECKSEPLGYV